MCSLATASDDGRPGAQQESKQNKSNALCVPVTSDKLKSCGRERHRERQSRHPGSCDTASFLGATPNYCPESLRSTLRRPSQTEGLKDGEARRPHAQGDGAQARGAAGSALKTLPGATRDGL